MQRMNDRGSILIFTLWTLAFLAILASYIGLTVRQRATLLSKVETRSTVRFLADAGIKKGIAALRQDLKRNNMTYTPYGKFYRHNNPEKFENIGLGDGAFEVSYVYHAGVMHQKKKRYGIIDEESKINLNTADLSALARLIRAVVISDEESALKLAEAIIDWRSKGESEMAGFYSDDYYDNLKEPYQQKNAPFERVEELLLVKGFNRQSYDKLEPFVTVYGDGLVNVNTASKIVLLAVGFGEDLADKLLAVRQGYDGEDATVDDYIFYQPFDIAIEMKNFIEMDLRDFKKMDAINDELKIKTNSDYYSIHSAAHLKGRKEAAEVVCVYNVMENRIEYWNEK